MRLIRPIKPFFLGQHYHDAGGAPFEVPEDRARDLVKQGIAEFVVDLQIAPIQMAVHPAAAAAELAVARRQKRA